MVEKIRILIADDHAVVRTGIAAWIDSEVDLELIGEASDGDEAVTKTLTLRPDVILIDLVMPGKNGIDAIADIIHEFPEASILAMTSFSEKENAVRAVRAGALGFMMKDTSPTETLQAIREVYLGNPWLSPELTRLLIHADQRQKVSTQLQSPLTEREIDVLKLIAQGSSDTDIADTLTVSKTTVRFHVSNILSKLRAQNRTQAALYAIKEGYVTL